MIVSRGVSHPFESIPSQLPKPALHVRIRQLPEAQLAVALARAHDTPHAVQLLSESRGVSHPLPSEPSQLPYPGLQLMIAQLPVAHVAVALARPQAFRQVPQFVSVVTGVSQPLASTPSQSANPGLHVAIAQVPVPQVAVALARTQETLQPPQFVSVVSEVSQPFMSIPSQSARLALHMPIRHVPPVQTELAPVRVQAFLHVLQLLTSFRVSISQPVARFPSQSANPVAHVHRPLEQKELAPHTLPQAPQLFGSVCVLVQPSPQHVPPPSRRSSHGRPSEPQTHSPFEQAFDATEQLLPQNPQLSKSARKSRQPAPLQQLAPSVHAMIPGSALQSHVPFSHASATTNPPG